MKQIDLQAGKKGWRVNLLALEHEGSTMVTKHPAFYEIAWKTSSGSRRNADLTQIAGIHKVSKERNPRSRAHYGASIEWSDR